jgi:hypothetical protein
LALPRIARRLLACRRFRLSLLRRLEFYTRAAGLGQPDRDGLLGRTRTVFALTDMLDLLVDEFARLSGWRLSLSGVPPRASDGFLFRHTDVDLQGVCHRSKSTRIQNL